MQHILIPQGGWIEMSIKRSLLLIVVFFVLFGCSPQKENDLIQLHSGYYICFVNNCEIVLGYKANPERVGYETVIENYYITAYMLDEEFIYLSGILTQDKYASIEELNDGDLAFYLIDIENSSYTGPFHTEKEFWEYNSIIGLVQPGDWISVSKYSP